VNFAFDIYPQKSFLIADANFLPLKTEILDCVVLGSVLLHLMQWEESLAKVAELNSKFLIVHRQPVIIEKPSYYYFKKAYSTKMFEWILNRDHLIKVLASFDYKLVKESKVNSNETSNYSSILPTTSTFTFIKT
jgi:predicted nucleic-acid-binding protein